jgi:hypothetical protein
MAHAKPLPFMTPFLLRRRPVPARISSRSGPLIEARPYWRRQRCSIIWFYQLVGRRNNGETTPEASDEAILDQLSNVWKSSCLIPQKLVVEDWANPVS